MRQPTTGTELVLNQLVLNHLVLRQPALMPVVCRGGEELGLCGASRPLCEISGTKEFDADERLVAFNPGVVPGRDGV